MSEARAADPWLRCCPLCKFPVGRGGRGRGGKLGRHSARADVAPLSGGWCPGQELRWAEGLPHYSGEPASSPGCYDGAALRVDEKLEG